MKPEQTIGKILTERGLTLGLAESCTGGLISQRITDIAGSSAYFMAGIVTYSNEAKKMFLSVPEKLLSQYGAVSEAVALKMASGIRKSARVDIGISVTGIAGPGGGTPEKPVGLVFIALSSRRITLAKKFIFEGNRRRIRRQASDEALTLLLDYLEGRLV